MHPKTGATVDRSRCLAGTNDHCSHRSSSVACAGVSTKPSEEWAPFRKTVDSWLDAIAEIAPDRRRAIVVELEGEGGGRWRRGGDEDQRPPLLFVQGEAARVRDAIGKYKLAQDFVVASGLFIRGD